MRKSAAIDAALLPIRARPHLVGAIALISLISLISLIALSLSCAPDRGVNELDGSQSSGNWHDEPARDDLLELKWAMAQAVMAERPGIEELQVAGSTIKREPAFDRGDFDFLAIMPDYSMPRLGRLMAIIRDEPALRSCAMDSAGNILSGAQLNNAATDQTIQVCGQDYVNVNEDVIRVRRLEIDNPRLRAALCFRLERALAEWRAHGTVTADSQNPRLVD